MGNLFRENCLEVPVNCRIKTISIIGQRKHSMDKEFQSLAVR